MAKTKTAARRYTHQHPDRDILAVAVTGVAHWLTDLRLDLHFAVGPKATK